MKNVLSIQSHVVYGYAGNKAAVLPMQLLGAVFQSHSISALERNGDSERADC